MQLPLSESKSNAESLLAVEQVYIDVRTVAISLAGTNMIPRTVSPDAKYGSIGIRETRDCYTTH